MAFGRLLNRGSNRGLSRSVYRALMAMRSGPNGYAIREPEVAKSGGLLGAVRSKFPNVELREQGGQGFRQASLR